MRITIQPGGHSINFVQDTTITTDSGAVVTFAAGVEIRAAGSLTIDIEEGPGSWYSGGCNPGSNPPYSDDDAGAGAFGLLAAATNHFVDCCA